MRARPGMTAASFLAVSVCIGGAFPALPSPAAAQPTPAPSAPVPFGTASIERGEVLYARRCTECHGPDGRAQMDVIADATDLTSPDLWYSGTERDDVFSSIENGAGVSMPPYAREFDDREIWDLVNFIQSLWPESRRPPLEEE